MTHTASQVIQAYVKLRDAKLEKKHAYDAEAAVIDAKLDKLESWLLTQMDALGTSQFKSPEGYGTAYIRTQTRASCGDWGILHEYIQQTGRFDFMEKRVAAKAVQDFLEETGDLPPGVNIHQERVVTVNRG